MKVHIDEAMVAVINLEKDAIKEAIIDYIRKHGDAQILSMLSAPHNMLYRGIPKSDKCEITIVARKTDLRARISSVD